MPLSGQQLQQLHSVLLERFTHAELAQMVRFELNENLAAIAGGSNLSAIVFSLIEWAERRGRVIDLLEGARKQRPGEARLLSLWRELAGDGDELTAMGIEMGMEDDGLTGDPLMENADEMVPMDLGAGLTREEIRLDVATPESVEIGQFFWLAVAVMQKDSPPLAITDLDSVVSEAGEIFRAPDQRHVRYRVEIVAPDFDVPEDSYIFTLEAGRDSKPRYFQLKPRRDGALPILVNAYQVSAHDNIVAQTRLTLTAVVTSAPPVAPDRVDSPASPYEFVYSAAVLGGLAVRANVGLNPVHSALLHLIRVVERPLVTVKLTNETSSHLRLRVLVEVEGYSRAEAGMAPLAAGASTTLELTPAFDPTQIAAIGESTAATVRIRVEDIANRTGWVDKTLPLQLLAINSAPLAALDPVTDARLDLTRYFGAFVTPHDAELDSFIHDAAAFLPAGHTFQNYQTADVTPQVQALYDALSARETVYVDSTLDFNPADPTRPSQWVRMPREVLTARTANCIDGTLLMASLLERVGIEPAIILLPRHALLGWAPYAGADDWSCLETTKIGRESFADAWALGERKVKPKKAQWETTGNDGFYRCWPLRDLRAQGITPVPKVIGDELGRIARALEKNSASKPSGGDTIHVHIGDNARNIAVGKDIVQRVDDTDAGEEGDAKDDDDPHPAGRTAELAYLADLIQRYQFWAEKYTPLAGIAEVRTATVDGPRLDLPTLFMPTGFDKLVEHGFGPQREIKREPVDDLRIAIEEHRRLVVLGEPGSGKTTTLWRLVYDLALAAQDDLDAPLPLLVPLGGYTGAESPLDFAAAQFGELGAQLPDYLKAGRVVLLLDALNEMPQRGYRARVGRIQRLLDEYEELSVVVTCRALDYVEELALEKLEIKPLDVFRQRDYLQRYLGEADGEHLFWQLVGDDEVAVLWQAWQAAGESFEEFWTADTLPNTVRIAYAQRQLWEALRTGPWPQLLELGANPYMLVMLAQVYAAKGAMPQNRGKLFAAFVETLLAREAKRRQTNGDQWPGADAVRSGLATLAFAMQEAGERGTAVNRGWAVTQLAACGSPAGDLLYAAASGTLLDINDSRVRFVHQLIQEYFAALAWQGKLADDDLNRYWPDGWLNPTGWEETAILLAGIVDDMTPLVTKLLAVNPPLAARCIAESGGTNPGKVTIDTVQSTLVQIATNGESSVPKRNAAGIALNHLGDPRLGVGVQDGLPAIDWVQVPESDPQTGQREFIYQENERRVEPTFWIARCPITYAQFQTFVDAADGFRNPEWWDGLAASEEHRGRPVVQRFKYWNHPRENVSWYDAMAFCRWLTAKMKAHVDWLPPEMRGRDDWQITLPTEWQWEKAARGYDGRSYPWGDEYQAGYANINETYSSREIGLNYLEKTSAVGTYPQGVSPFGVQDMSGNVWEWCLNEYQKPDRIQTGGNAIRVLRGGAWDFSGSSASARDRYHGGPNDRYFSLGFRVVLLVSVPIHPNSAL